jgi:hypothetical protein
MYRTCIFCAGALGANEALEEFPVGRTVAFDAWKGRLWAVCPRCARWNLAPIEERWEAIESADRIFSGSRLRVQSENVGLARLPDGTRLIRIGEALPGELAAWRYGDQLVGRRRRYLLWAGAATAGGLALVTGGIYAGVSFGSFWMVYNAFGNAALSRIQGSRRVTEVTHAESGGPRFTLRRWHLAGAYLAAPGGTEEMELHVPGALRPRPPAAGLRPEPQDELVLRGSAARGVLGRAMLGVNRKGASRNGVRAALRVLEEAGSAEDYVRAQARRRRILASDSGDPRSLTPDAALALEMALHEESERRVLQGELALLAGAWREAEEIAAIADALPGDAPVVLPQHGVPGAEG